MAALLADAAPTRRLYDRKPAKSMSLHIRPYESGDEARVAALWRACGLIRPWNDPHADIARKLAVQPELFLIGIEAKTPIATAMAGYDGHRGWINYLAVDPARRRRGHALAMLRAAEAGLLALGCPKVNLQIRSSNTEAIGFYRRIGYLQDDVASYGKRLSSD